MTAPTPDRRHIEAAREVALQFRALTGIGDDPNSVAAWTDTIAELIGSIRSILQRIRQEKPEIWPVITEDGRLWEMVEKRSGA